MKIIKLYKVNSYIKWNLYLSGYVLSDTFLLTDNQSARITWLLTVGSNSKKDGLYQILSWKNIFEFKVGKKIYIFIFVQS